MALGLFPHAVYGNPISLAKGPLAIIGYPFVPHGIPMACFPQWPGKGFR